MTVCIFVLLKIFVLLHAPDPAMRCNFAHNFHKVLSLKWIQVFH